MTIQKLIDSKQVNRSLAQNWALEHHTPLESLIQTEGEYSLSKAILMVSVAIVALAAFARFLGGLDQLGLSNDPIWTTLFVLGLIGCLPSGFVVFSGCRKHVAFHEDLVLLRKLTSNFLLPDTTLTVQNVETTLYEIARGNDPERDEAKRLLRVFCRRY